jgi:plastocyanin
MTTTRTSLTLASALALALSFGACGDDDNGNGNGNQPDAANGGAACAANFANCATFEDMTGMGAVSIDAPNTAFVYTPKCIRVSPGTAVTIEASSFHPLRSASCSPEDFVGGQVNATGTYTLNDVGVFGYFCVAHGSNTGGGMAGAIEVVE